MAQTKIAQFILSQKPKAKTKLLKWVKPSKSSQTTYQNGLQSYLDNISQTTEDAIFPILQQYQDSYARDSVAGDASSFTAALNDAFDRLTNSVASSISGFARSMAGTFVNGQAGAATDALRKSFVSTYGVDITPIIAGQNLSPEYQQALAIAQQENVALIKSIPSQYLDKVERAVMDGVRSGQRADTIKNRIRDIHQQSWRRCRTIARDQAQKIINTSDRMRGLDMGIKKYQWRTVEDERVRHTHAENDLKYFRLDTPPPVTGHPGNDVNCRCVMRMLIEI